MNIQPDFEELLRFLEERRVDYMIVGGYAVAFHGYVRFTKDIDIFYDNSPENVKRLADALEDFGFSGEEIPRGKLEGAGNIVSFGVEPVRVDLINEIDGVSFAEARPRAARGKYGRIEANFISRDDLLKNKRTAQRTQDMADAEKLE
jgi:predicted nucleotidyltransferase